MRTGINYAKCAVTAALFAISDVFLQTIFFCRVRMSNKEQDCRRIWTQEMGPKNMTSIWLGGRFVCSCWITCVSTFCKALLLQNLIVFRAQLCMHLSQQKNWSSRLSRGFSMNRIECFIASQAGRYRYCKKRVHLDENAPIFRIKAFELSSLSNAC